MKTRNHRVPDGPLGAPGPCWIICGGDKVNVSAGVPASLLTVRLPGWGKVLPVFGSEEDALGFLRGWEPLSRSSMRALRVARSHLASALLDAFADVDRVVFDPLPEPDLRDTMRLASLCRGAFVDLVFGRGRVWSARSGHRELS